MNKKISIQNLSLFYGNKESLHNINMQIPPSGITAFIGPSGCGKSSLLRCLNRMCDLVEDCTISGTVFIDGQNIYDKQYDVTILRKKVGMVAQKPNPFPVSIYDNIAYGPKIHSMTSSKEEMDYLVEESLKKAGLFNQVKDKLSHDAYLLSGGQQQRLCIARALAINPDILLMDEPCSALDHISTAKIEDLLDNLKMHYTIIIVTHSMSQAARISQKTAFIDAGKLIEFGNTKRIFMNPKSTSTQDYITGRKIS